MVPINKVKDIINKHINLEKELSDGNIDPKLYAKKSKEYSNLGNIIETAKLFVKFESEKKDLENIVKDKSNDPEMIDLAEKDLSELFKRKEKWENDLKIFYFQKMRMMIKMQS